MSTSELLRLGLTSLQGGNLQDAECHFQELLRLEPESIPGLNLYSVVLTQLGRLEEAERHVRKAIELGPPSEPSLYNHATILKALKRPIEAIEQFTRAIAINSRSADALNNRGTAYMEVGRVTNAAADFERAIAARPNYAEAYVNLANALVKLGSEREALARYEQATAINPNLAEAWLGRGNLLSESGRHEDAGECLARSVALNPGNADAWMLLAANCLQRVAYQAAFDAFDRALALQSDLANARCGRMFAKLHLCDWSDYDHDVNAIRDTLRRGQGGVNPSFLVALPFTPTEFLTGQAKFAERYSARRAPPAASDHDRIRIAYVSSDFHAHATAELAAGLFESHDRRQFEVIAVSSGPDDETPMRRRLECAFDRFHDVRSSSDAEVAALMRQLEVDIAIDLKGWTQGARFGVFVERPAPIQVTYLGFPGTTGRNFFDYLIADQIVVPDAHKPFYTEKIVWLPDTYQANDRKRRVADTTPSRAEHGLPDDAFVFCCFNNLYKVTPPIFDVWMRLLKAVPGSVLWLTAAHETAQANLRSAAQACGVAAERIVISKRVNNQEHLARHRHADLVLDTLPYNAHTTAADALWMGVPIVTLLGEAFPGRVAASLLNAIGMTELVTTSLGDYEALSLKLARDPGALAAVRTKLETNRKTATLFDTPRFARNIEAAYLEMIRRLRAGLPPAAFSVASAK
ncbi:tetratricopeptide repeat protein [Microbacteriaceae bacterium K1510]|nr:tetratricopeptide repeat protein [Microbacteriaceae bacterium K1510]